MHAEKVDPKTPNPSGSKQSRGTSKRIRGYLLLAGAFLLLWIFAQYAGPWLSSRIPVFNEIVQLVDEREINANAYFYTEIEASYDAERYLNGALELSPAEGGRVGWFFVAGVAYCLVLLWIAFHKLPLD